MVKRKKKVLFICVIASALIAAVFACGFIQSRQSHFKGTRTSDTDLYLLDFTYLDQKDTHTMSLHAGDVLHVEADMKEGKVIVEVGVDGKEPIYRSDDMESGEFDLPVSKDGAYTILIDGIRAKGTLNFTSRTSKNKV